MIYKSQDYGKVTNKTMKNKTVTMELWWQKPDLTRCACGMKG